MASRPQPHQTFEEYLELERRAEYKSEYHGGDIYAMSGGTLLHSRLSARMCAVLDRHFPTCQTLDSNLKVYVRQADRCFYPDAMLLCGEPEFYDAHQDVITNPLLVVEVLSPSTRRYDQGAKADCYRSVPSIEHILLISQDQVFLEHFARQQNQTWIITSYSDRGSAVSLPNVALPIDEIYGGIL